MLSDNGIRQAIDDGEIGISPYDEDRLQPASIDLTLHPSVRVPDWSVQTLNVRDLPEHHTVPDPFGVLAKDQGLLIRAGGVMLGCTEEVVSLGSNLVGRIEGKSSLARLFLSVHVTGGFIDPGFEGQVTLEIVNHSPWNLLLWPGMPICQIAFDRLDSPPSRTYERTGRYQGQRGPTESRYTI